MPAAEVLQRAWQRRGPLARALWPLGALVAGVAARRRRTARHGQPDEAAERLPVAVIVVGNLVVGGAGKTPTTLALIDWLRSQGRAPGVVSRGYGRRATGLLEVRPDTPAVEAGDEPLLIARRAHVPVVVGADRVAAVRALLAAHPEVDVVVSDDGLQHHHLARDLQLVVFDERGAGNGWCLPAGPLREPMPARPWPGTLVVYNADRPTTAWPGTLLERRLTHALPLQAWQSGDARERVPLAHLSGQVRLAAAGIARPDRFFAMLRTAGLELETLALPDHHPFDTLPWPADTAVLVTEKDAVKLDATRPGRTRVWVAPLDFGFDEALRTSLTQALREADRRARRA